MNRHIIKWVMPAAATIVVILMLSPGYVFAWYPDYPYTPYFQPYSRTPYPIGPESRFGPRPWPPRGYYGYAQPKWSMRGRINRYGDYHFNIKLRGVSQHDLYRAWLLFRYYRNQ